MKIINNPIVVVSQGDMKKLLTKFIEKKTGKKVVSVDESGDGSNDYVVKLQPEEGILEEPKND